MMTATQRLDRLEHHLRSRLTDWTMRAFEPRDAYRLYMLEALEVCRLIDQAWPGQGPAHCLRVLQDIRAGRNWQGVRALSLTEHMGDWGYRKGIAIYEKAHEG